MTCPWQGKATALAMIADGPFNSRRKGVMGRSAARESGATPAWTIGGTTKSTHIIPFHAAAARILGCPPCRPAVSEVDRRLGGSEMRRRDPKTSISLHRQSTACSRARVVGGIKCIPRSRTAGRRSRIRRRKRDLARHGPRLRQTARVAPCLCSGFAERVTGARVQEALWLRKGMPVMSD